MAASRPYGRGRPPPNWIRWVRFAAPTVLNRGRGRPQEETTKSDPSGGEFYIVPNLV